MTTTDKFKLGRNYVRLGDHVKVKPSRPGKHDGFKGRVCLIRTDAAGGVTSLDIPDQRGGMRTIPIDRIQRVAQSRQDF